eukprot:SAG22_NODE_1970_length_3231_cov_4.101533_7_plen_54_part_00
MKNERRREEHGMLQQPGLSSAQLAGATSLDALVCYQLPAAGWLPILRIVLVCY